MKANCAVCSNRFNKQGNSKTCGWKCGRLLELARERSYRRVDVERVRERARFRLEGLRRCSSCKLAKPIGVCFTPRDPYCRECRARYNARPEIRETKAACGARRARTELGATESRRSHCLRYARLHAGTGLGHDYAQEAERLTQRIEELRARARAEKAAEKAARKGGADARGTDGGRGRGKGGGAGAAALAAVGRDAPAGLAVAAGGPCPARCDAGG